MKKVLIGLLFASNVFALDYIGPPKASVEHGQVSVEFDYSYSRQDVEAKGEVLNIPFKATVEDVESNKYYVTTTIGLADYLNIFGRLGTADASYDDGEFNGSNEFAWGFGIKATFFEQGPLTIGGIGQISWTSSEDRLIDAIAGATESDYDAHEIEIAVGPTVDMGGWFLYGGAFYYILEGDIDDEWEFPILGITKISADIEEDSNFGGFIGAQLPIGNNVAIGIDSTIMSNGYAIGGAFILRF